MLGKYHAAAADCGHDACFWIEQKLVRVGGLASRYLYDGEVGRLINCDGATAQHPHRCSSVDRAKLERLFRTNAVPLNDELHLFSQVQVRIRGPAVGS